MKGFFQQDLFKEEILEALKPSNSKGGWGDYKGKVLGILTDVGKVGR